MVPLRGGHWRFFGSWGRGLLDRYFEAVDLWGAGSFEHIFGLPPRLLALYLEQGVRIRKLKAGGGQ